MRYELRVTDELGGTLIIPLLLDGSESDDKAVERFKDAITVARLMYAQKWGTDVARTIDLRNGGVKGRLDGFPE